MCRQVIRVLLLVSAAALAAAQPAPPAPGAVDIFPVKDLRPGMKATGYSVFLGDQVEAFPVEIVGVMKNAWGPRQDVILARLGDKLKNIGVASGMSGSPVYIGGKLLGAISLRVGIFTNEPVAGITPAESMMEISELDQSRGPAPGPKVSLSADFQALLGTPASAGAPGPELFLAPIDTPLVFSGFHEAALRQFADVFRQMGVTPVQGGAGGGARAQQGGARPERRQALAPGSAVAAVLLTGDLSIAGTGTVTYNDGRRVLAFGHPLFNLGRIAMPMAAAEVITVLGSPLAPFKIANTGEIVGTLRQDRHSGLLGVLGERPPMVPVEATVRAGRQAHTYHFEVFQHPRYTPMLLSLALLNSLLGVNEYGDDAMYKVRGAIRLRGLPEVRLENVFASPEGPAAAPNPLIPSLWIAERFSRIFNNPFEPVEVSSVQMELEIVAERRTAVIEQVWPDRIEVRPGETLNLRVALRPYRGDRLFKDVAVKIPPNAARGDLRIALSDAEFVNRLNNAARAAGLSQLIAALNREQANGRLYVSLVQSVPTAVIEDKVMPSIPSSFANVIDPIKTPGRMTLQAESFVEQQSVALDHVVFGMQTVTVTVK
jgi:hypothetical protein